MTFTLKPLNTAYCEVLLSMPNKATADNLYAWQMFAPPSNFQ